MTQEQFELATNITKQLSFLNELKEKTEAGIRIYSRHSNGGYYAFDKNDKLECSTRFDLLVAEMEEEIQQRLLVKVNKSINKLETKMEQI